MSGELLQVARVLQPITALGPGRRVAVWLQGCTLGCSGCASTDTWDPAAGTTMSIATLEGLIADLFMRDATLTGLTITGGEPLQQSAALTSLLRALKARWLAAGAEIDVLLFTGYALRAARARAAHVLDLADVVVAGPYRAHHGHGGGLLGSTNQELLVKSDLGRARLAALETAPSLQVTMVGTTLTMVGLPRPGDLDRLRSELEVVGIEMGSVSWQP